MMQIVLIGMGAGAAAALLFASVASGSIIATLLFYLAPLPILIAALGWSHLAALVAVLSAASGLAAILGGYFVTAFLIGVGVPAWWLAARIVKVSGRLRRPWPDLSTLALPPLASGLLAAAIAGSFLPDLAGILAGVLAASLFMAYAMVGFAVLHAITRSIGNRGLAL